MSYIGKEIELIKGGTIKVKSEKETENGLIVVDDKGNIYTEDELNLTYKVTPEYIFYTTLKDNDITDMEWDSTFFSEVFEEFMNRMCNSGYLKKHD